jgi:membrane protease YdiL (CAAX protease family)
MSDDVPPEFPEPEESRLTVVALAVAVEGGLVVAAVLVGTWLERHPLENCRFDVVGVVGGLLATVPMVLLALLMLRYPIGPLRSIQAFSTEVIRPLLGVCTRVDLLGISCLAGLGEEMLFRGMLQDALVPHLTVWGAVALASLLFGLLHAVTPTYAILATCAGAYLGGLYVLTNNLLAPILSHALYDFVLLYWLIYGPGAEQAQQATQEPSDSDTL